MEKYIIQKDENDINVFGYNQTFTQEDINDLWEKHKILYLEDGIMAVWIEEREGSTPLVHLMSEDDGYIFWNKERDKCFSSYWLDNYINTLTELKNRIKK